MIGFRLPASLCQPWFRFDAIGLGNVEAETNPLWDGVVRVGERSHELLKERAVSICSWRSTPREGWASIVAVCSWSPTPRVASAVGRG